MNRKLKAALAGVVVAGVLSPAAAVAAQPGCVYTGGGWACYGTYPPGSGGSVTVERVSGQTRFDTAVQVSKVFYPDGADTVYLVTVADFPDALAAGGASSVAPGPVLYTNRDSVPAVTLDEVRRLAPERVVIVGGTGVVSEAVAAAVQVQP